MKTFLIDTKTKGLIVCRLVSGTYLAVLDPWHNQRNDGESETES